MDFHGVFVYEEKERNTLDKHTVIRNNTFQNCTSSQTACFQFKWISNDYEFVGNTFQNNDLLNYLGEFDFMGKKINGEFYFGRNKFINNTARSLYGGGSALWFQNKEEEYLLENRFTLILDECQFIGNHAINCSSDSRGYYNGNGGAIQLGWTESLSNINLEIRDSMFINNIADRQGGALSIEIIGYTIIDNCTFNGNKAGNEPNELNQVYGGAIHTWPDFPYENGHYSFLNNNNWIYSENITITNSKFSNNQADEATSIYIQSATHTDFYAIDSKFIDNNNEKYSFNIVSDAKTFVFERSRIEYSDKNKASSGIKTSSLTKITDSHFLNNCAQNETKAEALLFDSITNGVEISDTIFEDCGRGGSEYSVVKIKSPIIHIYNNVFNFSSNDEENSCRPLLIQTYSDISFIGNRITNSNCRSAFQYAPITGNINNENIKIRLCTFEKLQGENTRALGIRLSTPNITFSNNTIQDCQITNNTTGYLFAISISNSSITELVIDNIIFRNLVTNSEYGGGSGSWIQNNVKYTLTFRDCTFENNHAKQTKTTVFYRNGKGGALQYGWTPSISNVDMKIDGCTFNQNMADDDGGALCLMIQGNIEISGCKFINNQAGVNTTGAFYGGAISIAPDGRKQITESIIIDNCIFTGNCAHDANAIHINRAPQTDLIITNNCHFLDNIFEASTNATIIAETLKLEIDDSIFNFTSLTKSSNAITTNSTTVILDNTQFYHCILPNQEQGSALLIKEGTNTSKINNCNFIDNGNSNKGSVIYTEARSFEFSNSEIGFTELSASDRGIYAPSICNFYLYNSYMHHCSDITGNGGSFYYEGQERTGYTEEISLENVHFYNNSCSYASAFYMKLITNPKLNNLTVQDHQSGNFVIIIIFNIKIDEVVLVENCTFDNNCRSQSNESIPDCGGIGLWIACANQSTSESFSLSFDHCTFNQNKNNYCGGAIAYGFSQTFRYIIVDLNDCTFENNTCDGKMGGALAFDGHIPVTITRSIFKGNKCNSDNYEGHCIYIYDQCTVTINDCIFLDNGVNDNTYNYADATFGHSIIQCSGNQLNMNNCTMNFTDSNIVNSRCIAINFYSIFSIININNVTFTNCNVGKLCGGAINVNKYISSSDYFTDEPIIIENCVFENIKASNGCAAFINATVEVNNSEIEIRNCSFVNNKALHHGGAIAFQTAKTIKIYDCLFSENTANYQHSSSNLLFEDYINRKTEGIGGALYINPRFPIMNEQNESFIQNFEIYNSTFKSNSAFDGCAIYIEGEDPGTKFVISHNIFIDNYYEDENQNSRKKGIITSEIFNLYDGQIENEFIKDDPLLVNVLYIYPPTNIFTKSDSFTMSDIFTKSDVFTQSEVFISTTIYLTSAQKLTQSISLSITYSRYKSVSYSISHFESETYLMSYNSEEGTYLLVLTQSNFYNYFPYIIYYYTPLYVETFIPIAISSKQRITKEQLIGVVCGSVSVFFLILGIIILVIQKKLLEKLKYEDLDDFSESSGPSIKKEETKIETKETQSLNQNIDKDDSESDMQFWL